MIKISIIVPIYNSENYLRKCLESLVNQTLKEIEIILVNDASPDNSYITMEEYKHRYPDKIKNIYLEKNMSQGGARNRGIEIACGKYIMFVDSDDWIHVSMCEKLYNEAIKKDYDIVGSDYYKVDEDTGKEQWNSLYFRQQIGNLDQNKKSSLLFMFAFPWAKLIRRTLILENHLYFPAHMKYEDAAVVPLYFVYADSMSSIEEPLYYYNIREGSTSHLPDAKHHHDKTKCADIIYNQFNDRRLSEFSEEAEGLYIKQICDALKKLIVLYEKISKQDLEYIGIKFKEIYPKCKKNYYYYLATDVVGRKVAELLNEDMAKVLEEHGKGNIRELGNYYEYYKTNKDKINCLFNYCKENDFKVAIWGAGLKGNNFLSIMDKEKSKICCVIDNDKRKNGKKTKTGHLIADSNRISKDIDFIIVMNKNHYASIKHMLKSWNKGIKAFNLDLFLLMKNSNIELFVD